VKVVGLLFEPAKILSAIDADEMRRKCVL